MMKRLLIPFYALRITHYACAASAQSPESEGLRDIKPPVEISSGWEWLWWTLAALAALAILFWAWRFWRKRAARPFTLPVIPPHVRARRKLEEALALLDQPRSFCIAVSDAIRVYLEDRFRFHAPERTTEEFLSELRATDLLSPQQKESLGEFLSKCDLVKFARHEPAQSELKELHHSAVRLVDETAWHVTEGPTNTTASIADQQPTEK